MPTSLGALASLVAVLAGTSWLANVAGPTGAGRANAMHAVEVTEILKSVALTG